MIGFIGIIVLLLIFNYFYPILTIGNANLNENSQIGELYQIRPRSEENGCSKLKEQECQAKCYRGCKNEQCIDFRCNKDEICKFTTDVLCIGSNYICVLK